MKGFKLGIKISLIGTFIEAVGLVLDILHHLDIGIKTPEGLVTGNHLAIFTGFVVNFIGVFVTLVYSKNTR